MTNSDDTAARLDEALVGRYRVVRLIGAGGMASVHLARDVRHDRDVAIKVMHGERSSTGGSERFLTEIRVTATLQHPHILPLLDSGDAGGLLYYVMPFVSGETLRARLDREGALSVADAVRLTTHVASALEYAHRRGVVHRDMKPENVLLADGFAIVADFGIARALEQAVGTRLTQTGMALGTPAYMSPEQVTGDLETDARSDQYGLACMLYEMLAGKPPYGGATANAVMVEHVIAAVPTATSPLGPVPAALVDAIRRAMAKDPAERFATTAEFANAISAAITDPSRAAVAVAPAAAGTPARSIVVLPFANLSPDADDAYFADGLTGEIIADLAKVRALRVISRQSAMQLKGSTKDTRTIGRELGVQYVLEGTVRRAGQQLRVTAQLTDAARDATEWSEKYGGTMDDVFEIQERLAREIVGALRLRLTSDEERLVGTRRVRDAVAWDCYLRARQHIYSGAPAQYALARELLARAAERVGDDPLVLSAMALERVFGTQIGVATGTHAFEEAIVLAQRALAKDPDCTEALVASGLASKSLGRMDAAIAALRRALEIEPSHADALMTLTWVAADAGNMDEARRLLARATTVSPLEPTLPLYEALVALFDGRFDDLLRHATELQRTIPTLPAGPGLILWAQVLLGDDASAREWTLPAFEAGFGDRPDAGAILAFARARLGVGQHPDETLTAEQRAHAWGDSEICWWAANCLAALGDRDGSVRWMRRASELGLLNHPFLTHADPILASLRGYAPYDALMAEIEPSWRRLSDAVGRG